MARAACAEMHAGFTHPAVTMAHECARLGRHTAPNPERSAEIARIETLWSDCRARFGANGPWLFGEYSVADAMYAPVVLRFRTYGARLRDASAAYLATVLADAHMLDWLAAPRPRAGSSNRPKSGDRQ